MATEPDKNANLQTPKPFLEDEVLNLGKNNNDSVVLLPDPNDSVTRSQDVASDQERTKVDAKNIEEKKADLSVEVLTGQATNVPAKQQETNVAANVPPNQEGTKNISANVPANHQGTNVPGNHQQVRHVQVAQGPLQIIPATTVSNGTIKVSEPAVTITAIPAQASKNVRIAPVTSAKRKAKSASAFEVQSKFVNAVYNHKAFGLTCCKGLTNDLMLHCPVMLSKMNPAVAKPATVPNQAFQGPGAPVAKSGGVSVLNTSFQGQNGSVAKPGRVSVLNHPSNQGPAVNIVRQTNPSFPGVSVVPVPGDARIKRILPKGQQFRVLPGAGNNIRKVTIPLTTVANYNAGGGNLRFVNARYQLNANPRPFRPVMHQPRFAPAAPAPRLDNGWIRQPGRLPLPAFLAAKPAVTQSHPMTTMTTTTQGSLPRIVLDNVNQNVAELKTVYLKTLEGKVLDTIRIPKTREIKTVRKKDFGPNTYPGVRVMVSMHPPPPEIDDEVLPIEADPSETKKEEVIAKEEPGKTEEMVDAPKDAAVELQEDYQTWLRGSCRFRCKCSKAFPHSIAFWKHVAEDHDEKPSEYKAEHGTGYLETRNDIRCQLCDEEVLHDFGRVKHHFCTSHPGVSLPGYYSKHVANKAKETKKTCECPFGCGDCGKTFETAKVFRKHLRRRHEEVLLSDMIKRCCDSTDFVDCGDCGRRTTKELVMVRALAGKKEKKKKRKREESSSSEEEEEKTKKKKRKRDSSCEEEVKKAKKKRRKSNNSGDEEKVNKKRKKASKKKSKSDSDSSSNEETEKSKKEVKYRPGPKSKKSKLKVKPKKTKDDDTFSDSGNDKMEKKRDATPEPTASDLEEQAQRKKILSDHHEQAVWHSACKHKCPVCDFTTLVNDKLRSHIGREHTMQAEPGKDYRVETKYLTCPICEKSVIHDYVHLRRHLNGAHREKDLLLSEFKELLDKRKKSLK